MSTDRDHARGRTRETPLGWVGVVLAVLFLAGAVASLATDPGRWSIARLAVAASFAGYAAWFLLRARRRDRAADAADPPRP